MIYWFRNTFAFGIETARHQLIGDGQSGEEREDPSHAKTTVKQTTLLLVDDRLVDGGNDGRQEEHQSESGPVGIVLYEVTNAQRDVGANVQHIEKAREQDGRRREELFEVCQEWRAKQ